MPDHIRFNSVLALATPVTEPLSFAFDREMWLTKGLTAELISVAPPHMPMQWAWQMAGKGVPNTSSVVLVQIWLHIVEIEETTTS